MYWPLLSSVEVARSLPHEAATREDIVAPIRHDVLLSLTFLHDLTSRFPLHMRTALSASRRLSSVLRVLCCGCQLYLDAAVAAALRQNLAHITACSPHTATDGFVPGTRREVGVLTQVYVDTLEEFVTASYGSEVRTCLCVCVCFVCASLSLSVLVCLWHHIDWLTL